MNLLQMPNYCRMVDAEFFSNFLCSCKRISFGDWSRIGCCQLPMTSRRTLYLQGYYLLCKTLYRRNLSSLSPINRGQFSRSVMSDSVTPWTAAHQASLSITSSRSLLKLMSIESMMPSNHLIPCHPLLLLPSIFPSIRVFSNESVLHIRWPEY